MLYVRLATMANRRPTAESAPSKIATLVLDLFAAQAFDRVLVGARREQPEQAAILRVGNARFLRCETRHELRESLPQPLEALRLELPDPLAGDAHRIAD